MFFSIAVLLSFAFLCFISNYIFVSDKYGAGFKGLSRFADFSTFDNLPIQEFTHLGLETIDKVYGYKAQRCDPMLEVQ